MDYNEIEWCETTQVNLERSAKMNSRKRLLLVFMVAFTAILLAACSLLFPPAIDEPKVGDVPPITSDGDSGTNDLTLTLSANHANFSNDCLSCHADGKMLVNLPIHELNESYADCALCHDLVIE